MSDNGVSKAVVQLLPLVQAGLEENWRAHEQAQDHLDFLSVCGESLGTPLLQVVKRVSAESRKSILNPNVVIERDHNNQPKSIHFLKKPLGDERGYSHVVDSYSLNAPGRLPTGLSLKDRKVVCKAKFADMLESHRSQNRRDYLRSIGGGEQVYGNDRPRDSFSEHRW